MSFSLDEYTRTLGRLPLRKQIAFAVSVCERLLRNYEAFYREDRYGDPQSLREGVNALWTFASTGSKPEVSIKHLAAQIVASTPDPGEFKSIYASAALDACNAVHESLVSCVDPSARRIAEVASFARDTVDMFIQIRDEMSNDDPDLEAKIKTDRLMIRELQRQRSALDWLADNEMDGDGQIEAFRSAAQVTERIIP